MPAIVQNNAAETMKPSDPRASLTEQAVCVAPQVSGDRTRFAAAAPWVERTADRVVCEGIGNPVSEPVGLQPLDSSGSEKNRQVHFGL